MDIQKELEEKAKRIHDINAQLSEITKKIGVLQEEGRAIHMKGMEIKGAIDFLLEQQAKERAASTLITPPTGLLLPAGVRPSADSDLKLEERSIPLETAEGGI